MTDAAPKRIWMTHEDHGASWSGSYRAFRCSDLDHSSDDGPNPEYPEYILASEHAALIQEAEARGRIAGLEDARNIASLNAWMHVGDDARSQGMDAGARHQSKVIHDALSEAINAAKDTP